jgi:hypothetical protein
MNAVSPFAHPRVNRFVLSLGLLALLVACGGGGNAPASSRTVTGSMTTTRYFGTSESTSADDLSNATIAGLVPEGSTYRNLTGTGKADGSFTIPNFPPGAGWVRIREAGTTYDRYIWTDASQVNLNFAALGDPAVPLSSSSSTRLSMDPAAPGLSVSSMDILSPKAGYSNSLTTSTWPATFSWVNRPLFNSSRDTDLIITGLATGTTPAGDPYRWITGDAQSIVTPFAMQDGVTNAIQANLLIQGTPLWASIKVSRDGFSSGLFNPRAAAGMSLSTEYRAQFLGGTRGPMSGAQARILTHSTPTLSGVMDSGQLPFGDPFPAAWTRLVRVAYSSYVPFTFGTGTNTYTLNLGVGTTSTWKADAVPAGNLAALVGPVGNLKANGQSMMTPLTGQGSTPLLTWDAPSIGQATSYSIWVINLDTDEDLAYFTTPQRSLQLPAGILPPGARCLIWITAYHRQGGYDGTRPYASGWPFGTATAVSEPYIP